MIKAKMQNNSPAEILEALKKAQRPILCIDSRLDFDAFCSALAFYNFCKKALNKELKLTYYMAFLPERFEGFLKEITENYSKIEFSKDPSNINFEEYDLHIYLDSGNDYHISYLGSEYSAPKMIKSINIDHHDANPYFGTLNFVEPSASACSVLYKLFNAWGFEIDSETAALLLLGLYTDSMSFQTENMTSAEFIKTADLVKISSLKVSDIARRLRSDTLEDVKIKQIVFKNITINYGNRFVYSYATMADYSEYNLDPMIKTVPPVDLIKNLKDFKFAFFIREDTKGNEYNISLRSSDGSFDVSAIAVKLGGGGHKMAASCSLKDVHSIQEAVDIVLETSLQD